MQHTHVYSSANVTIKFNMVKVIAKKINKRLNNAKIFPALKKRTKECIPLYAYSSYAFFHSIIL